MTELLATTTGLYPLPDPAKAELADLKGHQKHDLVSGDESEAVRAVYERVRRELIDDQLDAGLDRVVEGQARWDDMLAHPLAVHDSVETRGIVRYYDNNNFYREPVVTGDLAADGDVGRELESAADILAGNDGATGTLQAVLPGPWSLSRLATDEHYGDDAAFLDAIADFLADAVAAFPDHATLYVLEPSLVTEPPVDGAQERASDAIDRVASATGADVVVHTYWGVLPEKVHAHLLDAAIDAVGYDLVSAAEESLELVNEYGTCSDAALGIVDGQNTLIESAETVRERVDWWLDGTNVNEFDRLYLAPNTELFYLPVSKYRAKLAALAEATATREVRA